MKIEKRKISNLQYYPGNPRKINDFMLEKLKSSIQSFGIVEPLIINSKNEETGNIAVKAPKKKGIARPGNVIKLPGNNETWSHPAMFPVGLPEFFIKLTTEKNDTVLDPFLGSGSTLIAAEKTGRICYGIDLKPEYIDIVLARWENFTGKKAKKID